MQPQPSQYTKCTIQSVWLLVMELYEYFLACIVFLKDGRECVDVVQVFINITAMLFYVFVDFGCFLH